MKRMSFLLCACLILLQVGCSSMSTHEPIPGDLVENKDLIQLYPVSLYGSDELMLGARWAEQEPLSLVLCDRQQRELDTNKPLVLYIDGEHQHLPLIKHDVAPIVLASTPSFDDSYEEAVTDEVPTPSCHRYGIQEAMLEDLAHCKQAMLRVFFKGERVDQRVSGTESDYMTRPRHYGPQMRLQNFVKALSKTLSMVSMNG